MTTTHSFQLEPTWTVKASQDQLQLAVAKLYYRGVPGNIAEFGTMLGNTADALAIGIVIVEKTFPNHIEIQKSVNRQLHLFDSFQGMPAATAEPDLKTPTVINGQWAPGTCKGISPDQLRKRCSKYLSSDRIHISEGWFKDTIPKLSDDTRFALVHIDCDLYSSTMDVLDGLLSRGLLEPGALIFFDDWDCNASRPDIGERKAWADAVDKYDVKYSYSHPYAATGQVIIFHDCAVTKARR